MKTNICKTENMKVESTTQEQPFNLDGLELESSNDDGDVCSENEIETKFSTPYKLLAEESVSLNKNYILDMDGFSDQSLQTGIALSNNTCIVYQINESSIKKIATLKSHTNTITNVKFMPNDCNQFLSSSLDGHIKLWDLRTPSVESKIMLDNSLGNGKLKPITSFDISKTGFVCGGTELIGCDAFLLFWDIRSSNLLGGYWESHTDDITQIHFHKRNPDLLASGSTDGLINVYDISQNSEDEALLYTYNTESSVEKINWYVQQDQDCISCITYTEGVDLWKVEDGEPYAKFTREKISKAFMRKSTDDCYIADIHEINNEGDLLLLGGSNKGKGECLRSLKIEDIHLKPQSKFYENKQIVRCSWYRQKDGLLITGGESGIISIWSPGKDNSLSTKLKTKLKLKNVKHNTKPY